MRPSPLLMTRATTVLSRAAGPSSAEIAQLLHIDLPKPGNKSFWQLAQYFPGCGVGMKFYRKTWRMDEGGCYWEVTRVKQKVDNTGKYPDETPHGKAWGIMTWNGETDGREREVRGTYKKVWKYLPPE